MYFLKNMTSSVDFSKNMTSSVDFSKKMTFEFPFKDCKVAAYAPKINTRHDQ